MARLLQWPVGLRYYPPEPLSGPRTVGAAANQSVGGFVQTSAAPFGLWRLRFTFPPLKGQAFRRYRGWVTALHGGANATRVPLCDRHGLSLAQRGIVATHAEWKAGKPWSNGMPWSNGKNWKGGDSKVAVQVAAAAGATEIQLANTSWAQNLDYGDWLGFVGHYAWYQVTERIAAGRYRIWPPLSTAITTSDRAIPDPVQAMRMESEEAATVHSGPALAEGLSVILVQVLDPDVRTGFAD